MVLINVMFEGYEDECDVITVPEICAANIEELAQMFCDWLVTDDAREHWHYDERFGFIPNCETDGFVDWLNKRFGLSGKNAARIIKRNTNLDPMLPVVEF